MHNPPTVPGACQYAAISRCRSHIARAYNSESTITIIDLGSQGPSQFIDAGMKIEGLAFVGDVLLVVGSGQGAAWLLTEEGMVDGIFERKVAGCSDSIWTTSSPSHNSWFWEFLVAGPVGVIITNRRMVIIARFLAGIMAGIMIEQAFAFILRTETGKVLECIHLP